MFVCDFGQISDLTSKVSRCVRRRLPSMNAESLPSSLPSMNAKNPGTNPGSRIFMVGFLVAPFKQVSISRRANMLKNSEIEFFNEHGPCLMILGPNHRNII